MALEQLSERTQERSQQVIGLLSELSERLRKAEGERDTLKREMLTIRECIQDLNDRNDQTEKAIVAIENRFDGTETQFEGSIRRLSNMEESVDKQSTELLAILRKMEERFDIYDREYKNHAASIGHYGDTLDRFDKKLEKLMQDKGRLARKLDSLEFELADLDPHLHSNSSPVLNRSFRSRDDHVQNSVYGLSESEDTVNKPEPTWTPTQTMNDDHSSISRNQKIDNASRVRWINPLSNNRLIFARRLRYTLVLMVVVVITAIFLTAGLSISKNPALITAISKGWTATIATLSSQKKSSEMIKPIDPIESSDTEKSPTTALSDITPTAVLDAGKIIPDKDFFSSVIRSQMDSQIVMARKLEDNDTARLMTISDKTPLKTRIKRDLALPRAIKAIEDKAAMGNADAQHDMGALYTSGQSGVSIDYPRAAKWFEESARNGMANARYNLGVLSQQGLGVPKDIDQALAWYRTAALLEHPEAQYNLGIAYLEGIGVAYNPSMAAGYFEQAAKGGVVEAAFNLGLILENGLIDEPRPFESLFWYRLAMDGGSNDGSKSFMRLTRDLKIDMTTWKSLFTKMITERPDLKQLADSRQTRAISLQSISPKVRIHTGKSTNETTLTTQQESFLPTISKPDQPSATNIDQARTLPPFAPSEVSSEDTLLSHLQESPNIDTSQMAVTKTVPNTEVQTPQMIARIQTLLSEEGLYNGPLDGRSGPGTMNAIRRYQTKYKMTVNGTPSTEFLTRMIAKRLSDSIQPASGTPSSP